MCIRDRPGPVMHPGSAPARQPGGRLLHPRIGRGSRIRFQQETGHHPGIAEQGWSPELLPQHHVPLVIRYQAPEPHQVQPGRSAVENGLPCHQIGADLLQPGFSTEGPSR